MAAGALEEGNLVVGLLGREGQRDAARVHHLLVERARDRREVEPVVAGNLGSLALEVVVYPYSQSCACHVRLHPLIVCTNVLCRTYNLKATKADKRDGVD